MPLKVNGQSISWTLIVPSILGILWLGGLSYQVNANADDLDNQSDTTERLVKIETTLEYTKIQISEIDRKIDKILDKIDEIRR